MVRFMSRGSPPHWQRPSVALRWWAATAAASPCATGGVSMMVRPVRVDEGQCPGRVAVDRPAAFVDAAMMEPAQRQQVLEIGQSAVEPVDDVVGVEPAATGAPREPAPAVAEPHGAS